jgi:hypothetical protein
MYYVCVGDPVNDSHITQLLIQMGPHQIKWINNSNICHVITENTEALSANNAKDADDVVCEWMLIDLLFTTGLIL